MFKLRTFNPKRTFGVELEFPAPFDRGFLKKTVESVGEPAVSTEWGHHSDNSEWIAKTDSSCGFELASRVLGSRTNTWETLRDIQVAVNVCDALKSEGAKANDKCGTHVHIWIGDLNDNQKLSLLSYWVKFEKTLTDMMPPYRKENSYCPKASRGLRPDTKFNLRTILSRGFQGRGALNWGWYEQRKTIEIRLAEGTQDSYMLKNWLRFLFYFIDRTKTLPVPSDVNWLTLEESLSLLDFYNPSDSEDMTILSPALVELRAWMLQRTEQYAGYKDSDMIKKKARRLLEEFGYEGN